MNLWTELSVQYASQKSYLDDLFSVYPIIPDEIRNINPVIWSRIEKAFDVRNNVELFNSLIKLELFPIKDSYVAYLKKNKSAIARNPRTVNRICDRLYKMGLDEILERCSEPKETNRQIGPMFRRWIESGVLGITPVSLEKFSSNSSDAILSGGDAQLLNFAQRELNYTRNKGVDFIGRFSGQYVIGEAKFLTSHGGNQSNQFADAIATVSTEHVKAIKVAVIDGVCYIKGNNKMYRDVTETYSQYNIMSALVLRNFLYSL